MFLAINKRTREIAWKSKYADCKFAGFFYQALKSKRLKEGGLLYYVSSSTNRCLIRREIENQVDWHTRRERILSVVQDRTGIKDLTSGYKFKKPAWTNRLSTNTTCKCVLGVFCLYPSNLNMVQGCPHVRCSNMYLPSILHLSVSHTCLTLIAPLGCVDAT